MINKNYKSNYKRITKDDYRNLPEYKEADQKAFEAASAKMEAQQRWWDFYKSTRY